MKSLASKILIPVFLIVLFSIFYVSFDYYDESINDEIIPEEPKVALLEQKPEKPNIAKNDINSDLPQKRLKIQKRKELKQKHINDKIYTYVVSPYNNLFIDKINENIRNTLEENGINENTKVVYKYLNLDEDSNNENEIINEITKDNYDNKIIISYSDKLTNFLLENTNDIPIFSTLFPNKKDIEDTNRIKYGVETPIELKNIVKFIREVFKDKKIGVFYDNNDHISQEKAKKIEKSFGKRNIDYKLIGINSQEEIENFANFFKDNNFDAIMFVTGNAFVQNVEMLNEHLKDINIPLITLSLEEFYFYNSILSTGINYNIVGKDIGKEIVDFINSDNDDNRIEKAKEYATFLNKGKTDKLNLDISQEFLSLVDETI